MDRRMWHWKKITQWAVGTVLALDLFLLLMAWSALGLDARTRREQRDRLRLTHAQWKADVERAEAIRQKLPAVEGECDRFYKEQFLSARTGYSTVVADLGQIANRAGLRAPSVNFKQREVEKGGVIEVDVTATVEGDYSSLVRFINGLERSENLFLLNSLTLDQHAGGGIKLNLQLRSYFRS